ncbi:RidA family protein [Psychromonas sp. 14N.309.X.WAT.B.A12]|uniref:RidA family protein n=1 Tax=Psychromonas sp. 14N.309.X.WAT.B.A12 TaxID=2998322 RepID=UPI0025B1643C|nr:RidA family protein [Psychromonas sp. 14N.309.X.WAT.B.A12]MDN2664107.1 RidA family protein [Psychromonas sp. 14N.309.X.WAT.B.A12]
MIERKHSNKVLSKIVTTESSAYLAGQVADDTTQDVAGQTKQVLAKIDALLAEAGTDKTKMLSVTIWLANIDDKGEMNSVWFEWVKPEDTPARACVEARLARPDILVEMKVEAAR